MSTHSTKVIQPYLFFEGRCEEALAYYHATIEAETLMLMRFNESPDPEACSGQAGEKVMHSSFRVGETVLFASDGRCGGAPKFEGFYLTLTVPTLDEAKAKYTALQAGGEILMPLEKTFYSEGFGMLKDKFGVPWMVMVASTHGQSNA